MKFLNTLLTVPLLAAGLNAQAADIKGTIYDGNDNSPLFGATVSITGTTSGTITDPNGNFCLSGLHEGVYSVDIRFISFKPVHIPNITLKEDEVYNLQITLKPEDETIDEVVVTAKSSNKTEQAMIQLGKQSLGVLSAVSFQTISRTQDADASQIVKRVSGVSVQDNKFILVRGLSQRYNNVWINNATAPSSEADSRAFSFDVVPSSQINNMLIIKSPQPEYPADFCGGMIIINTKEIPSENSCEVTLNSGINTQSFFNDFLSTKSSGTDWLGFDNSFRSLDNGINSQMNTYSENSEAVDLKNNNLNNDWSTKSQKYLPELGFSVNFNRRKQLDNGSLLGLTSTLNYSNSYESYTKMSNNLFGVYDKSNDQTIFLRNCSDNQYNHKNKLCFLANAAWKSKNEKYSLQWKNMFNQNGLSRYTYREGVDAQSNNFQSGEYYYSSRTTVNSQFLGNFDLHKSNSIDFCFGYAYSNKNTPDRKRYEFNDALESGVIMLSNGNDINREYTYLDEHNVSGQLNWKKGFIFGNVKPTLKAGSLIEKRSREYLTRNFIYNWNTRDNTLPSDFRTLAIDELMDDDNYSLSGLYMIEEVKMRNNYKGNNLLNAEYLALDIPFGHFDLYLGTRYEHNNMELISNTRDYEVSEKSTNYYNDDFFNSVNLKYFLNDNNTLRLAFGESCNRPEFRELSSSVYYDFDLASDVQGNTELKTCYIDNYELRYEFYPSKSEQLILSAFYKDFESPIEWTYTVAGGTDLVYSYENAKSAYSYGLEADVKLDLERIGLKNLSVMFNGALIKSHVNFDANSTHRDRPMQGQSPYLINTGIYYTLDNMGVDVALMYNRIGKRIVGVGRNVGTIGADDMSNIPDSYEMPRNLWDLSIKKRLSDHWQLKFAWRDILAEEVRYTQIDDVTLTSGVSKTVTETTKSYKPGSTLLLGVTYKF